LGIALKEKPNSEFSVFASSPRPIAVVYHPSVAGFGGGQMVAAWVLQVLQETHDTILWCEKAPDFNRVDARCGTKLSVRPPMVVVGLSRGWRWFLWVRLGRRKLLRQVLILDDLVRLDRRWRPSVWVSSENSMFLPKSGLHYVHLPETVGIVTAPQEWSKLKRIVWTCVQQVSWKIGLGSEFDYASIEHRSVVNSSWTAREVMGRGVKVAKVVYPPVPPFEMGQPWAERMDRVVCLGRWFPLKRMEVVVAIVKRAREAGAVNLRLAFAGFWQATDEEKEVILGRCAGLDWIEWHEDLGREELQALVGSSRYGLHAMIDEQFGIAVAEMMTAGGVVFAHDSGGPPEILVDRRQVYADEVEGARKLGEVCCSPELQVALHHAARPRGLRFSPESFCTAIRWEIEACELTAPSVA
jgi:glycosyltransferase involved in cell wall biosynthesis